VSKATDYEIIAREVSGYRARLEELERRLTEVEQVNARLEAAALTTARALVEVSKHWDAVYEAMRRPEQGAFAEQLEP
jgi:prefoldin subunit 5